MTIKIKFRAWDEESSTMIYPGEFSHDGFYLECCDGTPFLMLSPNDEMDDGFSHPEHREKSAIMQFTGLKDRNGKEIYANDIIQVDEYFDEDLESNLKKIGLVVFRNGEGKFNEVGYFVEIMLFRDGKFWRKGECELRKARWDDSGNHNVQPTTGWKIVGNKFENPELLEKIND